MLPVNFFGQKKAWMTGEIMKSVLTRLNHRLSSSNCSILLLMVNAGCHPEDLKTKFRKNNFLSANTTSKLQPLDPGIIQSTLSSLFKKYVLSKIDECSTATYVVKSVNILIAVRWVAKAWSMVKAESISKCFKKAGMLDSSMDVVIRDEDYPFLAADELAFQDLMKTSIMNGQDSCTLEEYVYGEDSIPVCMEFDSDNGTKVFLVASWG